MYFQCLQAICLTKELRKVQCQVICMNNASCYQKILFTILDL